MKILCVGPIWRGSNAGGLFRALSREQCLVDIVDEFYYLSFHATSLLTKIAQRAVRDLQVAEFNKAILASLKLFKPDILLIYKGRFVLPSTLEYAKSGKCKLALFYPDVSMKTHGKYISLNMPFYDVVFTTKTFGIGDLEVHYGIKNAHFIPHGFDPDIHRKLKITEDDMKNFGCDVSFIGTYSPKKEKFLTAVKTRLTDVNLKIWGGQWDKASAFLKPSVQHTEVLGDMYAMAIQCSKINLGILNEQVSGASSGDLITSRTFHIPGCSGFLLHERNSESLEYFRDKEEAGFFNDETDIADMVQYYLAENQLREDIRIGGYNRAIKDHSLDCRAKAIIQHLQN